MTETAQVSIRSPWGNRDHVRNTVGVPALKMVDDVVDIKKMWDCCYKINCRN